MLHRPPAAPPRNAGLSRRNLFAVAAAGGVTSLLPGCSTPVRGPAIPTGKATQATVLGVPNERFYPAISIEPLEEEFAETVRRGRKTLRLAQGQAMPGIQLLAVSGGGENGAFGAGLLCGMTAAGVQQLLAFGIQFGIEPMADLIPGALVLRLFLTPDDLSGRAVLAQDELIGLRRERIQLLDADQSHVSQSLSPARLEQVKIDLAAAEHDAADLLGVQVVDFIDDRGKAALGQIVE